MMGVDVGQVTANLALTKGQLEDAQEIAKAIDMQTWAFPAAEENQPVEPFVRVPIGQYQAVLQLLDALS